MYIKLNVLANIMPDSELEHPTHFDAYQMTFQDLLFFHIFIKPTS